MRKCIVGRSRNVRISCKTDAYTGKACRKNMEWKIRWAENGFVYNSETIILSERVILLDGSLTEEETAARPHVYNDIHKAFSGSELSQSGTEQVTVYLAPSVYWMDDPKAMDTMQKREGYSLPFGMYITGNKLNIIGLSENPEDVVIAGNRGQSHACNGNYTMIHFRVEELSISNLTIGNYCSVDLVYPLNPALNYPKRTETITQAQLAMQQGEKLHAQNCRFVSRLNLLPVCGARRALYQNCHFESTDDALNGNAVYIGCDFDFYGNRPVYQATGTGAVFIDCLFRSKIKSSDGESHQYLTKEGGTVSLISCRYESNENVKTGWTKYPEISLKCYQYDVSQNGRQIVLGGENSAETVQLQGKKALEAYLFEQNGQPCANVGNLLGGSDGWDPMKVLKQAEGAGKTGIPTLLLLSADSDSVVSGESSVTLMARAYLFSYEICNEKVYFSVSPEDKPYVKLTQNADASCVVEGCSHEPEEREIVICACTESGLEAAAAVTVEPYLIQAPVFAETPRMVKTEKTIRLEYKFSSQERVDISEISWYRCDGADEDGTCRADREEGAVWDETMVPEGIVLCAVTKLNRPLKTYRLNAADQGKYIKAVIRPRVKGSLSGEAVSVIMEEPVGKNEVEKNYLFTDFSDLPDENDTRLRKGCWTLDCAKPEDIKADSASFGSWTMERKDSAWKYGRTGNGSIGIGLYQNTQGARLRYTPVAEHVGDMSMTVKADPAKTAGQGFGSAGQYMDFGIKFDTEKLTGYCLRVLRSKEASDAVSMALVEYRDGRSRLLTELQRTSCFLTDCTIKITLEGNKLRASAVTAVLQPEAKAEKGYLPKVELEAEAEGNPYGGILIWHTGTPGTGGWQNTTMLHSIEVTYGD